MKIETEVNVLFLGIQDLNEKQRRDIKDEKIETSEIGFHDFRSEPYQAILKAQIVIFSYKTNQEIIKNTFS